MSSYWLSYWAEDKTNLHRQSVLAAALSVISWFTKTSVHSVLEKHIFIFLNWDCYVKNEACPLHCTAALSLPGKNWSAVLTDVTKYFWQKIRDTVTRTSPKLRGLWQPGMLAQMLVRPWCVDISAEVLNACCCIVCSCMQSWHSQRQWGSCPHCWCCIAPKSWNCKCTMLEFVHTCILRNQWRH